MSAPVAIITGASQGIGAGLAAGYRGAGYAVVGVVLSLPSSRGDDDVAIAGDVSDAETARRAVDQALDRFGRIDTLINNAGIYIGKPFTQYTLEDYAAITAVNLTGCFHITWVVGGCPDDPERDGVRADAVCGVFDRQRAADRDESSLGARRRDQRRRRRILYLERATFVTGETLHVDGGQAAGGASKTIGIKRRGLQRCLGKRWTSRSSQHRLSTPWQAGYQPQPVEVPDGRAPAPPRGACADPLHRLRRC